MSKQQRHLLGFGPFSLDVTDHVLLREGQPVSLPPKALETLILLVQNPGRLVQKDELMKALWPDSFVEESNLNHYIWTLRKTLGETPGGDRYIETVPRRGYRFISSVTEMQNGEEALVVEKHSFTCIVTEEAEETHPNGKPRIVGLSGDAISKPVEIATSGNSSAAYVLSVVRRHTGLLVIFAGVVVAVGGFAYLKFSGSKPQTISSIAVLPFANAGNDSEMEYLSDGISESLINSLSGVAALKVMARSTVFRYKGRDGDPQKVGSELGVDAVLTGKVVQRGDSLIVQADLVRVADGSQLWGEQYRRKLTDIASLQSEISRDVFRNLRLKLSGAEEQKLAKHHTENTSAYHFYLQGRYHYFKLTLPEFREAIRFYQKAIDADPTYALAYAGLADAYRSLPIAGYVPSKEAFHQAKWAAVRALEIDGSLAEPHIVLGWVGFWFDWDWLTAERELQRAIELSPNNPDAHRAYAHMLSLLGRHDEAVGEGQRARELDPLTLITNTLEGQFLFYAGRDAEAISRLQKTIEINPEFWIAHNALGRVYIRQRRYDEAIAELTRAKELSEGSTEPVTQLGYALAKSGKRAQALATVEKMRLFAVDNFVPAYNFAMIHNGLGERDKALKYLEKSFDDREVQITFIKIDTRWDELRAEPRFQKFLRGIGFTQ